MFPKKNGEMSAKLLAVSIGDIFLTRNFNQSSIKKAQFEFTFKL